MLKFLDFQKYPMATPTTQEREKILHAEERRNDSSEKNAGQVVIAPGPLPDVDHLMLEHNYASRSLPAETVTLTYP